MSRISNLFSSPRAWRGACGLALACSTLASIAGAQPDAPGDELETPSAPEEVEPDAPAIELPVLLESADAPYPESERAQPRAVDVVLGVTIDASGHVTNVDVVESAGSAFDDAATSAARRFVFQPARRGGVPIGVRILHRTSFSPPEPVSAPDVATPAPPITSPAPPVAPPAPPVAPPPAPRAPEPETEVVVRGPLSPTERLEKSSDSVTVVRLEEQRKRSSDMGEVLARVPGVVVRRSGGLGSDVRFTLNGLSGEAVRMFVDGVPLWMSGYPQNVANIPVNAIQHVEIYRGVVPLRLSADALGGAVNFVTNRGYENRIGASYEIGSFGLHRTTGLAQYRHDPSGFVARVSGYVDVAENDYPIDVEVPDERGRLSPATVSRFHDAYSAGGLMVETGVVEKPWARRLVLKGVYGSSHKELQHNTVMTVPYGEVNYGVTTAGATLYYDVDFTDDVGFELVTTYAHWATDFRDKSAWIYDWYGERIRERRIPGEIEANAIDQTIWQNGVFGRAQVEWEIAPDHALVASLSPLVATQTGDEREQLDPTSRDPLTARRLLVRMTNGVGYEWNAIAMPNASPDPNERRRGADFRFQNTFNVKNYVYHATSEEELPGQIFRDRLKEALYFGLGDGMRFALTEFLFLKASYEYATRLPNPYETFGDGLLTRPNLLLEPEVGHNANFGPLLDWKKTRTGDWTVTLNGAVRDVDRMIVLLGNDRNFRWENVYRALVLSVEGGVSWTSPGRLLTLDTTSTYIDKRNASDTGTFAAFQGDRIPNEPWFLSSWAGRLRFEETVQKRDTIEPFYQGRYTHEFFRGWESQGLVSFKQKVVSQVSHDAGVTYSSGGSNYRLSATFEVHNFTDEKLFDNFGVQRPGRSFHFKLMGDLF